MKLTTRLTVMIAFSLCLFLLTACGNTAEENSSKTAGANVISNLTIQAPSGVSIAAPIYNVVETNNLGENVEEMTYLSWDTPDVLRARITGNQAQISAVPTYVGANLYNKGAEVTLINTLIWGNLYIIGPEGEAATLEDLKGKTVHVPFKQDMPDLVLKYLLQKQNIDAEKDLTLEYTSTPQEVVQLLAAGKAEYAVLPEHTASMAVNKARQEGQNLKKIMSLQEEWARVTGKEARIPQAGIIVNNDLLESNPEVVEELQAQLEDSVQMINEQPAEAAQTILKYQDGLQAEFIENLIPSMNLEFVTAQEAKEELEFFFEELATLSSDIIGGKLPDDGFYYQK